MSIQRRCLSIILMLGLSGTALAEAPSGSAKLTLQDCIRIALDQHQSLSVSAANLAMAEAMHQQAMSAYWPQIAAQVNASRADQDRTFKMEGKFTLPSAMRDSVPLLTGNQQPVTGMIQQALAQPIPINMDVKLLDRDMVASSLNLTYPLFTGLKREALVAQAEKGIQVAEQGQRRSVLEVIRDVKKYYYAAQFAVQMEQLARDTLDRFQALQDLTERLYQHGSLKVKKTDFLRSKTTTAITRTLLSEATYAREMAHEALGNAMGQDWNAQPFALTEASEGSPIDRQLQQLVDDAQNFNPDVQQLKLALQISEDQITEARSGYFPMIAFQAEVHDIQTPYHSGLSNAANRDGWTIGIGMQWNLFDGFLTSGKVDQAKAQQRKLQSQQILLDQGIALQIKQQMLAIRSSNHQIQSSRDAVGSASENRKLHLRAYQDELVETKDVIEAQVVETFAQGTQYRAQYALDMALLSLEYLVGQNVPEP